ncbi:hypothetical protein [Bacillus sp. REN3]|uniref:hypothetical protein n=1 Tax=Bacillus sp. REN3 TaxID=2802440 RepID=UPI001AEE271D|nr:hypothetical protein [Bacillus sp. REN3]
MPTQLQDVAILAVQRLSGLNGALALLISLHTKEKIRRTDLFKKFQWEDTRRNLVQYGITDQIACQWDML